MSRTNSEVSVYSANRYNKLLLPVFSQKALLAGKTNHLRQKGIYFLKILTTWKAADDLPKAAKDEDLFEDKYTILGSVTQGISMLWGGFTIFV